MALTDPVAVREYKYWLRVFSEHMQIFQGLTSAAPEERSSVEQAKSLQNALDQLHGQIRAGTTTAAEVHSVTEQVKTFKQEQLAKVVNRPVKSALAPTLINHMLDEFEEWTAIEREVSQTGTFAGRLLVQAHKLWLSDAVGHADSILTNLDAVEKGERKRYKEMKMKFEALHVKAKELCGYYRAFTNEWQALHQPLSANSSVQFPALAVLNTQAYDTMSIFGRMLAEIEQQRLNSAVLGSLHPLLAQHFLRESLYYLHHLGKQLPTPLAVVFPDE